MADFNKSALLILNEDQTRFLVVKKADVSHWLMPGGRIEERETPENALVREIQEELGCDLDKKSLESIGEYEAPAAGYPDKIVHIKMYQGTLIGNPTPGSEIIELNWLAKEDISNHEVSRIIWANIIPDLVARGILK